MLTPEEKRTKMREYARNYRKLNPEKVKDVIHRYRAKNKDVLKLKRRASYLKNKDKERETLKTWRKNNVERVRRISKKAYYKNKDRWIRYPIKEMWTRAKRRSVRDSLDFNITIEDIEIPTHCPVLGLELFTSKEHAKDNSPSLDRINNTQGYIKGNVRVISHRANIIKSFGSAQEHLKIAKFMMQNQII